MALQPLGAFFGQIGISQIMGIPVSKQRKLIVGGERRGICENLEDFVETESSRKDQDFWMEGAAWSDPLPRSPGQ